MPWDVEETDRCPAGRPWGVIAQGSGDLMGCHESRDEALRQQAALYANEPQTSGRQNMSETKTLSGVEIKDAEAGTVKAVFATLDVVDHDGDITVDGAFEDGALVRISAYAHGSWKGSLPVGRGTIRTDQKDAILDGQFFLSTNAGREHFTTVKELGPLTEWSYGYDVVQEGKPSDDQKETGAKRILEKLKVHEVSPVLLGAGINTRTLQVKQDGLRVDGVVTLGRPSFPDEALRVLGDVSELVTRVEGWGQDPEQKAGRTLSAANRERLVGLSSSLGEVMQRIEDLLTEADPEKHRDDLMREFMRYEFLRAGGHTA